MTKDDLKTMAVNMIIYQSDGFQLGYAQAIYDLIDNMIDYWKGTDDTPQESVLHTLVDLGQELQKRKDKVTKNREKAESEGYTKSDYIYTDTFGAVYFLLKEDQEPEKSEVQTHGGWINEEPKR